MFHFKYPPPIALAKRFVSLSYKGRTIRRFYFTGTSDETALLQRIISSHTGPNEVNDDTQNKTKVYLYK